MLNAYWDDQYVRAMATFVPDQLIFEPDLKKKRFRKINAVMVFVDVSRLFNLHEKFHNAENGGSHALMTLLNSYISVILEVVYSSKGDVLKFSRWCSSFL